MIQATENTQSDDGQEVKINLRARKDDRDLIDLAAAITRKTRTEFMLDSSRRAATDAVLDQSFFSLDTAKWNEFLRLFDAPVEKNDALAKLLKKDPLWKG